MAGVVRVVVVAVMVRVTVNECGCAGGPESATGQRISLLTSAISEAAAAAVVADAQR